MPRSARDPKLANVARENTEDAAAAARRKRMRHRLTQALAVVVILAVFGLIFPRMASYSAAWDVVRSLTANWILVLIGVTVLNLVANWWFITACLPGLGMPRAAAMNLSSTAVSNTVPAGGAIALGVSWNMASTWGISGETFTLYTLVSGLWSQFAKFGTPAIALLALVAVGDADRSLVVATILGTAIFLAALGALIAALHSDGFMAALGRLAQRALSAVMGWFHRPGPRNVEQGFLDFKHHASHLIKTRGWLMSGSVLASDLVGWLVQLACLRACGVTEAEVSWEKSFAGYALIRLLTTIPITPGGLGITEVGLTAYLAAGQGSAVTDRIAAAILLSRALTFVVPIPFGAVTFAVWKWLRRKDDVPRDELAAPAEGLSDGPIEQRAEGPSEGPAEHPREGPTEQRAEGPGDGPAEGPSENENEQVSGTGRAP